MAIFSQRAIHKWRHLEGEEDSVGPKPLFWFSFDTETEMEVKLYVYKLENRNWGNMQWH